MPRWPINFDLHVDSANPRLIQDIAAIHSLSRTIAQIPVPPYLVTELHNLNIIRAVRGTTGIEGVNLTEEEVSEVLRSPDETNVLPNARHREEREVRNANDLMRFVENTLTGQPRRPLSEDLILTFHRLLTHGVDQDENIPGRYREFDVNAGSYLPPEYRDVPRLMTRFVEWLNQGSGSSLDPIIQAIVAHFLLVSIHPFGDGNGRTSRGVESFLLYKSGINVRGFYSLANFYYQNRERYVSLLDEVRFRTDPDVTPFVLFALEGLVSELNQVHAELLQKMKFVAFQSYAHEVLSNGGRLRRPSGMRQLLFLMDIADEEVPINSLNSGSHRLSTIFAGVGIRTMQRDLAQLRGLGLIVTDGQIIRAKTETMDRFTVENRGDTNVEIQGTQTSQQMSMFDTRRVT